ncbi:hypothetical protein [Lacisediminihabitans sp.]|jgi:predicted nucleic acid-binding protein|uniref:hypothetical protein n=1 Tax=Lacisediminihabitans sp. TaxID=2787631 RepID=UPI002F95D3BE
MMLVDASLLVCAFSKSSPQHDRSLARLDRQFAARDRIGLPWESLNAFVRLVGNPQIHARPISVASAGEQVERWLDHPGYARSCIRDA